MDIMQIITQQRRRRNIPMMMCKLAALYLCIKIIKQLRYWSGRRHLNIRSGAAAGNPQEHALFKKSFIINQQGLWLFTRKWLPDTSIVTKGLVFIVHGLGEHIDRYELAAKTLTRAGFAVFGMDHQGHGRSDGDRVFAERYDHLPRDYFDYIQHVLQSTECLRVVGQGEDTIETVSMMRFPRFLLGHSMGGAIALSLAELSKRRAEPLKWNGLILSGPALKADPAAATPTVIVLSKLMSWVLPKLPAGTLDTPLLSRDPHVVATNVRDPLNAKGGVTVRLAKELLDAMQRHLHTASEMNESLLLLHGSEDKITMPQGSADYYHECKSKDVQLKVYPKLYHELLNSEQFDTILNDMLDWMQDRLCN